MTPQRHKDDEREIEARAECVRAARQEWAEGLHAASDPAALIAGRAIGRFRALFVDPELERLINLSVALESELAQRSQWHVFDKDDDTTWPGEPPNVYWVHLADVVRGPYVGQIAWDGAPSIGWPWSIATHWQEIQTPLPPEVAE